MYQYVFVIPLFLNHSLSVCKISGGMRDHFLHAPLLAFLSATFRRLIYFDKGMLQPYMYFYGIHT